MPRYLISFDDGAMRIPPAELPVVAEAAHAVMRAAKAAGVWVFGGGLAEPREACVVAADGTTTAGPPPGKKDHLGGFSIVEVPSREEALRWAARFAAACRCAQEVRELPHDPEV